EPFAAAVAEVTIRQPMIPFYSTLLATPVQDELSAPTYWSQQIRSTVRFVPTIQRLLADGFRLFVECGARPTLCGFGMQIEPDALWLSSLDPKVPEQTALEIAAQQLMTHGHELALSSLLRPLGGRLCDMPTYPFDVDARPYWLAGREMVRAAEETQLAPDGAPSQLRPATGDIELATERHYSSDQPDWLGDHRVDGAVVFPMAGYIELMLRAVISSDARVWPGIELREFGVSTPLLVDDAGVSLRATRDDETEPLRVECYGPETAGWVCHATAVPRIGPSPELSSPNSDNDGASDNDGDGAKPAIAELESGTVCPAQDFYATWADRGIEYGEHLRVLGDIELSAQWARARIARSARTHQESGDVGEFGEGSIRLLDPPAIDGILQLGLSLAPAAGMWLPVSCDRIVVSAQADSAGDDAPAGQHDPYIECRARCRQLSSDTLVCDLWAYDRETRLSWVFEGVLYRRRRSLRMPAWTRALHRITWRLESERPDGGLGALLADADSICQLPPVPTDNAVVATELERLSEAYICDAFVGMGWDFADPTPRTEREIANTLGVERHLALLSRMLRTLARRGLLECISPTSSPALPPDYPAEQTERKWRNAASDSRPAPVAPVSRQLYDSLLASHPDYARELQFLRRAGVRLAEVLAGELDPLQVLFPDGDVDSATDLYHRSRAFAAA
ncbi:MAG: polyketide synthase dehydratase domain-containing protein, partial [Myxococcota bacterium]